MNFDGADRRRVAVVSALTLLALPSLWLMSRDEPTAPATVAPGGVAVGDAPDAVAPTAPEPALGTAGGAFLDAPEIATEPEPAADEPIAIAVPAPPTGVVAQGRATYRSTFARENACLVAEAPFAARVTVTNVDNGRSITCVASVNPANGTSTDDVVLHTAQFTRIADLSDAPVPVELSW